MKRHPTPNEHLAPKQPDNSLSPGDLDDPEKLILIARKHFATSFPNESRAGCPEPGMIRGAPADRPPSDELRSHLFRCSECFNEYSAKIRNYFQQTGSATATRVWWTKLIDALSRWRLPLFTSTTASLLLRRIHSSSGADRRSRRKQVISVLSLRQWRRWGSRRRQGPRRQMQDKLPTLNL